MAPIAIVTGSSSGIGKATAKAFAQAGYDVGVTYFRNEGGAKEVANEIAADGRRAEIARLDLTQPESAPRDVRELIDRLGGVDVLVNNAGIGHSALFVEHTLEDWRRTLDVNLTGAFLCAQEAARHMIDAGVRGSIVNVTSVHEHVPLHGSAAYCASKGGLGLLTKVMALELAEHGIRVNAVAPGEIATRMTGAEDVDPQRKSRPMIPVGRPGHAREIADVIVFVASPQAGYATGESFVVDGGMLLVAADANRRGAR